MSLKAIEEALSGLALRRQADPLRGTFAAYAEDLARFNVDDVRQACRSIGSHPRVAGEKAFPDVGTIIAECERLGKMRREVNTSGTLEVYKCGRCDHQQSGTRPAACQLCGGFTHQMTRSERFDLREYVQDVRNNPEGFFSLREAAEALGVTVRMPQ